MFQVRYDADPVKYAVQQQQLAFQTDAFALIRQPFDDRCHLFAFDDRREGDGVTKTLVQDANSGVCMKVARAGLRLRPVNFIDIITMCSVIWNEDEIDGEAF